MAKVIHTIYDWAVNSSYTPPSTLDLTKVIDLTYSNENSSAIDIFIQKNVDLNKLLIDSNKVKIKIEQLYRGRRLKKKTFNDIIQYIDDPSHVPPVLANLVLLGHISAVESYFREIFKKVIFIDQFAQQACREQMLTYGAAITHKMEDLPDALLEQITFSNSYSITESLKQFLGIKGNLPNSITKALAEYSKACQLRHCIVHRFGKLGVNNAMKLDWDILKSHVEKPVKIGYSELQEISQICSNVVKEFNNYIWQSVMMRQIATGEYNNYKKKPSITWEWIWLQDKSNFKKYHTVFFSKLATPLIPQMKKAYDHYKNKYSTLTP